jgi:DNA-binding XRE family transcriptional regulator
MVGGENRHNNARSAIAGKNEILIHDVTIYLWEKNRVKPSLAQIPKIIEFLGYDPFEKETENLVDRIREYRRIRGLTQKKLAALLGVDQTTLAGWARGKHQPLKRHLENLISFFAFYPPSDSKHKE